MHRLETRPLVARFRFALVSVLAGSALAQSTGHLDPIFASGGKAVLSWNTLQQPSHRTS
ncbi:MAG: hypothetical protein AAGE94_10455 [Acidobacteriota bacterium]